MGQSEVKFGDKIFLYGQFMRLAEEFGDYEYNAVMGYQTIGGYSVIPKLSNEFAASMPGFMVDFGTIARLGDSDANAVFKDVEMADITDKLALSLPLPQGTTVWLPMPMQPTLDGLLLL